MNILPTHNGWYLELEVDPWDHQAKELSKHWDAPARALPWQPRTGKSMVIVASSAALWQTGQIDAVIIDAPSRVHHAWAKDEFPKHCNVPFAAHSWDCKRDGTAVEVESLARLRSAPGDGKLAVLSINKEALLVPRVWRVVRKIAKLNRVLLAVDESHHYGGAGSSGTKRIRALAQLCEFRRILSGTMVGNNMERVYSQFQILEEGALGYKRKSEFTQAHGVFVPDGRHWKQDKKKWRDEGVIRERMAQWGRPVLRSDCPDLPDLISSREYHELVPRAMAEHEEAMREARRTDPPNYMAARKLCMIGKDEALRQLLPGMLKEGPVVVWAPFQETVDGLAGILNQKGFLAAPHHGGMSTKLRERSIRAVQRQGGVLVSTPDSLGEGPALADGTTLSFIRNIVWYAPPWNSITFQQARERCTAMGGEATGETQLCSKDTLEEGMYRSLEKKIDVEDWLIGGGLRDLMDERGMW